MTDSSSFVSIWHAPNSAGDPGRIESRCQSWLDNADRERVALFRLATTRNQHIIGRGMSRRLLAGSNIDPRSIQFGVESHGKPIVTKPATARRPFNVTHTDGLVMCCVGNDRHHSLGIDVERLSRRTKVDLADRYFSQPEIRFLQRFQTTEAKRRIFLRIWTLKESFIKAIGTGLTTPLADFTFENIESDRPVIRMLNPSLESELNWNFYCLEPRPGFIAALAVSTNPRQSEPDYELSAFEDLIETD